MREHTEIAELLIEELEKEYKAVSLYSGNELSEVTLTVPSEIPQEILRKISLCGDMTIISKDVEEGEAKISVTIE